MNERIVCAANQYAYNDSKIVVLGIRHCDDNMWFHIDNSSMIPYSSDEVMSTQIQGFITNKNRFVTRKEAWIIAVENNQIIRDKDKFVGTLYSEHLY